MGIVNVLSAATPGLMDRMALLRKYLPLEVRNGSHLAATLSGFALLLLARHLWRRKRAAWSLTILILIVSAFSHLLKGLDYEESALSITLTLWLLRLRPSFYARSDRPSFRHSLWVCLTALVFAVSYGVIGLALLDHHFSVDFDPWQALCQVVIMFTQFDDPISITPFGRYFSASIYIVAASTMGYALLALVRPVLVRDAATPTERERARKIVEAYGKTTMAWFTLTDDKSYYFSPGGSMAAFVVSRRVCLAVGDVVGPPEDLAPAIAGFREFCARNDWLPAFLSAEPETLDAYQAAGLDALCVGQEAIVSLPDFTLAGGKGKDIRGRVMRLRKMGYVAEYHVPPLSDMLLDTLAEVSDEWLELVGGSELSFTNGAFEEEYIRACPVMTVRESDGRVEAFANFYPEYQRNEATIDLMRRRRSAENGTMEFLFVSLFEWAREAGYDTFNMGVSPLAGIGENAADPVKERALRYIFEHSQRFYNFKGLYSFKAKFHPHWSPRYLIYPGTASLLAVVMAAVRIQAGENFFWRYLKGRGTETISVTRLRPSKDRNDTPGPAIVHKA